MQFWNEQTLSFNLVYSSTCYPAGMGTSKIRLLFATLLQHYTCDHLKYIMGTSILIAFILMGKSIRLQGVNI